MSYLLEISGGTKNPKIMETVRKNYLQNLGVQVDAERNENDKVIYAVSLGASGDQAFDELNRKLNVFTGLTAVEGQTLPAEYGKAVKNMGFRSSKEAFNALSAYTSSQRYQGSDK